MQTHRESAPELGGSGAAIGDQQSDYTRKPSFAEVRERLLPDVSSLLEELLPKGKFRSKGKLYFACNPRRRDTNPGSFYVYTESGQWRDEASGDSGDIFKLIAHVKGTTDVLAKDWLAARLGMSNKQTQPVPATTKSFIQAPENREEERRDLSSLTARLRPILNTPVSVYLASRCLPTLELRDVFYHPAWRYRDEFDALTVSPAMVTLIRDVGGNVVGLHATIITHAGAKRKDSAGRKITRYVTSYPGALNGASMQLNNAGAKLGLGEGIETSLALGVLKNLPVWACGDAGKLARVQLPECVGRVWIAVDADIAGEQAAATLAARMREEGRAVTLLRASELVPNAWKGADLADVLERNHA